ncbi:hypothetical protein GF327_02235 [Candidatus Woesearchaeota archaeon]|nr:hypothetical protein [Candidatus Woesearchaeota archaeon]
MKKATIEIQFNWLFILIAGALILLFFIGITRKITKSSEETLNYDILRYLDEIISGVQISSGTEHSINLPEIKLSVDCDFYSIQDSEFQGNTLSNKIVFSQDSISKELLTYTLIWEAPFKNSYFIYLSSPDSQYVVVNDPINDFEKDILEILPKNVNSESVPFSNLKDIENNNYDRIRFIFFDSHTPALQSFTNLDIANTDISAIRIIPKLGKFPDGFGKIEFYTYDGTDFNQKGLTSYLNKATLLGAVFSEDIGLYECNMRKALLRLDVVSQTIRNRLNMLKDHSEVSSRCETGIYSDSERLLEDIEDYSDIGLSFLENIYRKTDQLADKNKYLQKESCPIIY